MTTQHDKAKRWQFGLAGLLVAVTSTSLPLAAWTWAVQTEDSAATGLAWLLSIAAVGGPIGGLWKGTATGFAIGYCVGVVTALTLLVFVVLFEDVLRFLLGIP